MTAIAAIGNLSRDVVAAAAPRPGGTVLYAGRALARLEADACIALSCAREDWTPVAPAVESLGLPVAWYESHATTAFGFHYDGDRRTMGLDAVGEPWPAGRAVEAVRDARWVHVGALVRGDFPEPTLAALARGGRRLLLDAQGLVRTPQLGELRCDAEIGDVLRHARVLHLNDEEAEILVGSAEPEAMLGLGVPEVLLTLGAGGSAVVADGAVVHVTAPEVGGRVDPTGAGDTFSAAYLAARAAGADPFEAAEQAAATVAAFLAEDGLDAAS